MLIAAWRMWVNQAEPGAGDEDFELYPEPPGHNETHVATRTRVTAARGGQGARGRHIVGFITGFFGVGGGFVVVPALVLALGFDMAEAVGTSLLVIAINSAVALATRIRHHRHRLGGRRPVHHRRPAGRLGRQVDRRPAAHRHPRPVVRRPARRARRLRRHPGWPGLPPHDFLRPTGGLTSDELARWYPPGYDLRPLPEPLETADDEVRSPTTTRRIVMKQNMGKRRSDHQGHRRRSGPARRRVPRRVRQRRRGHRHRCWPW